MKRLMTFISLTWMFLGALASENGVFRDSVGLTLDEISVTAIKGGRTLSDEPEAVTLLTGKEINELNIVSMRGVSDVVPNFFMPDYGSRITSTIYVRGIGSRMDQPSVGLNVDNVPYLNKDAYDFDIADIARVEMFRGPQSTLFGRNTIGGLINIQTLSPMQFQGWRAYAELGNGERIRANAGWYHKFSRETGFSIMADYSHLGGFFCNDYNGKKLDKENAGGVRTKFEWLPKDNLRIQNTLSANIVRQGGYPYEYIETGRIEYNDTCFYRRFSLTEGLTASWTVNGMEFSSITSVQHINDNMTLDQDFLPESYFTLTQKKKEKAFTEEIVGSGKAAEGKYRWIGGLFGFYKHLDMDAPVTFKDVGIRELIEQHRNDANPFYPIDWDTRRFVLNSFFTIPTWGLAAYHESEYQAGNWTFTAGIRLDYEKSRLKYHSQCNTGYQIYEKTDDGYIPYRHIPIDIDDRGDVSLDFLTLLPKVAVMYEFDNRRGNVYAKVSRGYKAGGFNTHMFSDVLQQRLMGIMGIGSQYNPEDIVSYKPEKSWNYELGSHLNFPEAGVSAAVAAFYIDCRDQQLTIFPDGTTTGRMMANAGRTRSVGMEISASWEIGERTVINGSYGLTDAKFLKFFNGIQDYSGKRIPYVPSNTMFLQGLYTLPLTKDRERQIIFDLNLRGTGPIYWNEENDRKQNFYCLLGASVTLVLKNWEIRAWGKNLTDTGYNTFYFKSMGNEFLQRGRGVEAGVSVQFIMQ